MNDLLVADSVSKNFGDFRALKMSQFSSLKEVFLDY